ncbi:DedA family protein [Halalkalibacter kiskunsagensis]|uniref:DedA family protein n=1 Tax=Halalkalibacter kiskunsagensis TaxID=1548599 RepID=A0ABV6K8C0_9BACI
MLEFTLDILREIGWIGLILGVAVEALSVPFPAALFVLVYGYLLNPSWIEILYFSVFTSLVYVAASFIPYYVSIRYENFIRKRLPLKKLHFAQRYIDRYGEWMIAIGRFIGMGYISYIAGLGNMKSWKFAGLTFIGFYSLSVLMFYLGTLGNLEVLVEKVQQIQWLIFLIIAVCILGYIAFRFYRRK